MLRRKRLLDANYERFAIFGRLRPGVDRERAREVLQAVFTHLRREQADDPASRVPAELLGRFLSTRLIVNSAARGHASFLRWQFERPLWILAAVVGLLLLVACSNVANLLLARAAARSREMTMRMALGAGRVRLAQQVLIECGLLAALAGVVGLGIASWTTPALVGLMSTAGDPAYLDVHPDLRMLAFLALVGMAATSLCGLAPALRASAVNAASALQEAGAHRSARTGVLRGVLAAQVGFSFMLLFVAGLLLLSFHRLTSVDLGFSERNVLLFSLDAGPGGGGKAHALQNALLDRLRHMPEVENAATSGLALVGGAKSPVMSAPVRFAGRTAEGVRPQFFPVSPGFFATMRIPLVSGRDFTATDSEPATPSAVIVNQFFVRQFFPGEDAVGKRFERVVDDEGNFAEQEIVGVVGDARYNNLREPPAATIYLPTPGVGSVVEVRTRRNPQPLAPAIRKAIQGVDPTLAVMSTTLQSARIGESILEERMLAVLGGFFALVAVVLAAVGLHGVLSYSVVRRTREIGVRMALGASFGTVIRTIAADIALTLAAGLAAGLAGGFPLARLVTSTLFEVKPSDFASVALPLVCLLAACAASALPPALRAARIDPAEALREQ
jgi:predicted permease